MLEKWQTTEKVKVGDFKIFDLYTVKRFNPEKQKNGDFIVLDSYQWVNIIPITAQGELILVEQYRHGSDSIELEIPAGLIEPGEAPINAAMRELREETGYVSNEECIALGRSAPNPAFLNNYCHHFAWFNCEKKYEQNLDENELIKVVKVPLTEVDNLVASGKIHHSLVLSAFYYFKMKYGNVFDI